MQQFSCQVEYIDANTHEKKRNPGHRQRASKSHTSIQYPICQFISTVIDNNYDNMIT